MNYLQLPADIEQELNKIKKEPYDPLKSIANPSFFAQNELKITPFRYQHYILRKYADGIKDNDRLIICKSRQIGLSICVAILAIWYAAFNKANKGKGTGIHKNTKVGIISKSDSQAKKLMREIQNMVWNAGHSFPKMVKQDRKTPLNKSEMWFQKGVIKCFPPTDACRGESFDLLIVDEAAFVDGDVFRDAMEPTVGAVGGKIILSSTPNGQKGFYFELFDPNDVYDKHEYERVWFYWRMCENEAQLRVIRDKRKFARETGNIKSFDQEYNALFTVDQEAFFEDMDVERGINRNLTEEFESDLPCSVGYDYGMVKAETAITVVGKKKDKYILLYQFAQAGLDDNCLTDPNWENSIQQLSKRFPNIQHIVVDDCAQGNRTNKEMENLGYPVKRFDFRSDRALGERNRGFYLFRAALKKGQIEYPDIRKLISQMKSLQETRMEIHMKIKGPKNQLDDRCDSFMMAVWPFLSDEGDFGSILIDYENAEKKIRKGPHDGRRDTDWENIHLEV